MKTMMSHAHMSPVLRVHLNNASHEATAAFVSQVDCSRILDNAIKNVIRYLYEPTELQKIPAVRSVTLVMKTMDGVAYTTGTELDDMHKEIHFSLNHVQHFIKEPVRLREECIGVITHEMVHCYQHNCHGTAPGGLIEGISDYVRLKCGLDPPHWKKTRENLGKKWDEGYERTAWFLEWLEDRYGPGTIAKMNLTMSHGKYQEKDFWHGLFQHPVGDLWKRYLDAWEKANPDMSQQKEHTAEAGQQDGTDQPEELAKKAKEFRA